jgi:hypothetical protein
MKRCTKLFPLALILLSNPLAAGDALITPAPCAGALLVLPSEEKAHEVYLRGKALYNSLYFTEALIDEMLSRGARRPGEITLALEGFSKLQDLSSQHDFARSLALRLILSFKDTYAPNEMTAALLAARKLHLPYSEFLDFLREWREEALRDPKAADLSQLVFYLVSEQSGLLAKRVEDYLKTYRFPRGALLFRRRSSFFRNQERLLAKLRGNAYLTAAYDKKLSEVTLSRIRALIGTPLLQMLPGGKFVPMTAAGRIPNFDKLPLAQQLASINPKTDHDYRMGQTARILEEHEQLSLEDVGVFYSFINQSLASPFFGNASPSQLFADAAAPIAQQRLNQIPAPLALVTKALAKLRFRPDKIDTEAQALAQLLKDATHVYLAKIGPSGYDRHDFDSTEALLFQEALQRAVDALRSRSTHMPLSAESAP